MNNSSIHVHQQWRLGMSISLDNPPELQPIIDSGLPCVELSWRTHKIDLTDPACRSKYDDFIGEVRASGLIINSLHLPYGTEWDPSEVEPSKREQILHKIKSVFPILRDWGIGIAVLHPSWEPVPAGDRGARIAACKQSLYTLAEEAALYGVRLAVECLPRTCLGNTAAEMAELMSSHPGLGICCDVNHLVQEPPEQFIDQLGSRIITTHISDNDGLDEKHWIPGAGVIRWNHVIGALARAGYRNVFMYEVVRSEPDQVVSNYRQIMEEFEVSLLTR